MKKILSLLLLTTFCISAFAQKKKPKKPLPPPRTEVREPVKETGVKEEKSEIHWETQVVAPPAEPYVYQKKEVVFDTLKMPANGKPCACFNLEMLNKNDKKEIYGENFKGKVKQIINLEKRDTTVGYWETLSLGNEETTLYSPTGMMVENTRKTIDRFSKTELKFSELVTKITMEYNQNDKPIASKIYFMDTTKPLTTLVYKYNDENGLESMESIVDSTSSVKKYDTHLKQVFKCLKSDENLAMAQYEFRDGFHSKAYLAVYNPKNQLIQTQEIENRKDIGSKNRTEFFTYNNLGQLLNKSILQEDGSKEIVRTYTNDLQGNTTKELFTNHDYNLYQYKYDAKGNWIWKQKTEYEKNRYDDKMEIASRITWDRKIEYY